ncbi:MAG: MmcQ/YjbR family DNA-binding protein [Bauldia sp.]
MADLASAAARLKEAALTYPETREDHPWGHDVIKVKDKAFLFLSDWQEGLGATVKLPHSFEFALEYPFVKPAGYGLGRARWVDCRFEKGEDVPVDVLLRWLDESFRAVAPKRLVKALGAAAQGPA